MEVRAGDGVLVKWEAPKMMMKMMMKTKFSFMMMMMINCLIATIAAGNGHLSMGKNHLRADQVRNWKLGSVFCLN